MQMRTGTADLVDELRARGMAGEWALKKLWKKG